MYSHMPPKSESSKKRSPPNLGKDHVVCSSSRGSLPSARAVRRVPFTLRALRHDRGRRAVNPWPEWMLCHSSLGGYVVSKAQWSVSIVFHRDVRSGSGSHRWRTYSPTSPNSSHSHLMQKQGEETILILVDMSSPHLLAHRQSANRRGPWTSRMAEWSADVCRSGEPSRASERHVTRRHGSVFVWFERRRRVNVGFLRQRLKQTELTSARFVCRLFGTQSLSEGQ